MRKTATIWAIMASAVLLTACYPVQNPRAAKPVKTTTVHIANNSFFPLKIVVNRGQRVTWINEDPSLHTVTGSNFQLKSGDIATGKTFSHVFKNQGEYTYHCSHHFWSMKGIVEVN